MKQNFLINGPISPEMIKELISDFQSKTDLGAHSIFLGQVRADKKDNIKSQHISRVSSIYYYAYEEMAEKEIEIIKEDAFKKFGLSYIYINHSIGKVKCGEISFLVIVSSAHREKCYESLKCIVNEIKNKVPIWKKELYEDGSYTWRE